MHQIRRVEVQCVHCKTWFPSPIQIGDTDSFDTSTIEGNIVQCPNCHKLSPCNKENMRWVRSDGKGGWVGIDTKSG